LNGRKYVFRDSDDAVRDFGTTEERVDEVVVVVVVEQKWRGADDGYEEEKIYGEWREK
jgi:hypothetical protein